MTSWLLENDQRWEVSYSRTQPTHVNLDWLELWAQENPAPDGEDFNEWWTLYKIEHDRCRIAHAFPQFDVWDWNNEDIATARKLIDRHTCGVCGRIEDAGCVIGC